MFFLDKIRLAPYVFNKEHSEIYDVGVFRELLSDLTNNLNSYKDEESGTLDARQIQEIKASRELIQDLSEEVQVHHLDVKDLVQQAKETVRRFSRILLEKPCSLVNTGNSCYFNSALQLLSSIYDLFKSNLTDELVKEKPIVALIKDVLEGENVSKENLLKIKQFFIEEMKRDFFQDYGGGQSRNQEDSVDFLRWFLRYIGYHLVPVYKNKLYKGSEVINSSDKNENEPILDLIHHNLFIQAVAMSLKQKETFDISTMTLSESLITGRKVASYNLQDKTPAPFLVFSSKMKSKLDHDITSSSLQYPSPNPDGSVTFKIEDEEWELVAIIAHDGASFVNEKTKKIESFGYYMATVRHKDKWFKCSDSSITELESFPSKIDRSYVHVVRRKTK